MTRSFTGWHMLAVMVAFFGVVIAVNMVMATDAIRTFGGVVVENSYVASQRYNDWLNDARAQKQLGWSVDAMLEADGKVSALIAAPTGSLPRAKVVVTVDHPLGLEPSRTFVLRKVADGQYRSDEIVGPGRWMLRIQILSEGREARFEQEVRR